MENRVVEYQPSQNISIIETVSIQAVQSTMQKINQLKEVIQKTLIPNVDYGVIPGSAKPTLLKPGAEKILMMLGVRSEFEVLESTRNFEQGFFQYLIKCKLIKNDLVVTEGLGSGSTMEKKYRSQDPYTLDNTVLKMAKKRALLDATLLISSLSDIYTQDLEDMDLEGNSVSQHNNIKKEIKPASKNQIAFIQSMQKKQNITDEQLHNMLTKFNVDSIEKLSSNEASQLINELQNMKNEGQ